MEEINRLVKTNDLLFAEIKRLEERIAKLDVRVLTDALSESKTEVRALKAERVSNHQLLMEELPYLYKLCDRHGVKRNSKPHMIRNLSYLEYKRIKGEDINE